MNILIHDHLPEVNRRRDQFILDRLEQSLGRFQSRIGRLVVRLTGNGESGVPESCCHISASIGPLGTVVVNSRSSLMHEAIADAVRQTARAIQRRVERRRARRHSPVEVTIPE